MKNISNLNNLKILKFDNQNFNSKWYEFLVNYSMYTMRYDLDYHNVEKSQSFNKYLDLSFIILNNDEPLAIIPFVLDLNNLYAWYREGHFMPAPLINENLSPKQIKVLENLIFKEVQQIISKYKITRWYIDADSLSFKKFNYFDLLPDKFLCTDMSFYNRIIDLDYDPSAIWKQIRKSYRNIITQGLRYFSFEIYDHTNFDGDPNKTYMKLHRKTSKKITRPDISYDLMNKLILNKKGLLFVQKIRDQIVQKEIVVLGKKTAIGASMADEPENKSDIPLTHTLNYVIYKELQKRKFKFFEIGLTDYNDSLIKIISQKEKKISFFKRGFGNKNKIFRRWVYFISKNEELKFYKEKLNEFSLNNNL